MHRFRTSREAVGFRLVSCFYAWGILFLLGGVCTVVMALIFGREQWQSAVIVLFVTSFVCMLIYWLLAGHYTCPLCMNPFLRRKRCNRNHQAAPLLGSYRLRIAFQAVFKGVVLCSYCGEKTHCVGRLMGEAVPKFMKERGSARTRRP